MAFYFGDSQHSELMNSLANTGGPSLICLFLVIFRGLADIKLGRSTVIDGFIYQLIAFSLALGLFFYATWNGYPFWHMIGNVMLATIVAWLLTKGIERLPDAFPESALYTLLLLAGIGFAIAFLVLFVPAIDAFRGVALSKGS